ncbi:MAG: hypothetical protein NTZ09_02785, partial [Candidatus Hydrogenedentes bacterium]|nr:hypothetical protein [Candidatus Hydrogenedentota bacterium]
MNKWQCLMMVAILGAAPAMAQNPAGLTWSTFLGGSGYEFIQDVAVTPTGVYVVGGTSSPDFQTTSGAYDRDYGGGAMDGFVAKFSLDGTTLCFATFLGGTGSDQCWTVQVDESGYVYVAG